MLPYLYILLAIAVRFLPFAGSLKALPHAWNFTPLAASLLFFGARKTWRQMWIPLALLMATDAVLNKYAYAIPLAWDQIVTWGWYAGVMCLGSVLREKSGALRVILAALTSSVSFFLISNFAVWAAWPEMYGRTFNSLIACYTAGIPFFFRGTVESDLFFSLAFFCWVPMFLHMLSRSTEQSASDRIAAA